MINNIFYKSPFIPVHRYVCNPVISIGKNSNESAVQNNLASPEINKDQTENKSENPLDSNEQTESSSTSQFKNEAKETSENDIIKPIAMPLPKMHKTFPFVFGGNIFDPSRNILSSLKRINEEKILNLVNNFNQDEAAAPLKISLVKN